MSIIERKAEIINNYFYKDMGNISNRKIWNTLKDIHTHKDLNLFELKVNKLIRETSANKSWADIHIEAKATVFIRKLGIEIKGHKYDWILNDDIRSWIENET